MPIPYPVAYIPQAGALKRKIDATTSDEELDVDSVSDDDSQMLDIPQLINDEVDLEVAIRERLATTIEGRIQWALQLLDALSNVTVLQDQHLDADDFQEAALDALEALEAPSSFIFDTAFPEERSPSPPFSPIVSTQPVPQRVPKTRSARTPKASQQKKHLYIKLPSIAPENQFAILACSTCSRTQFTTLQGLLNHARLAHGVEWASHDACIAACAVPISVDAHDWETYERDGVEVPWGGSVVGLRRLFERAVGVDVIPSNPALVHATSDLSLEGPATVPSTLLSRTLGLHADSPALAQFLGRAPKRRCIHVYDEDQHIDIMTFDEASSHLHGLVSGEPAQPKKGFRMYYPHRNTARRDLDLVVNIDAGAEIPNGGSSSAPATIPAGTTPSRFHITARVRLEDRSLFLKEGGAYCDAQYCTLLKDTDRRTQFGTTDQYRWMLGVTAPSYSLPLSSFLTCVTVVPPKTVSPVSLAVQQQPFAIIGTANEPFTAKVTFEWVGGGKMEVEHWVELDQSKSCTSVFGSEQLLDVELDRNTSLLPAAKGNPPLPSLDRQLSVDCATRNTFQTDPEHANAPTNKEEHVRSRTTAQIPYKLVASPAHLLALVPGRRKAIEWARARALHALYIDYASSAPSCRQTTLTVGDVYIFLEDGSYFPRPSHPTPGPPSEPKKKGREKDGTVTPGEEFCPTCGIKKCLHPGHEVTREEGAVRWTCAVVSPPEQQYGTRFPLTNLSRVLTWSNGLMRAVQDPPLPSSSVPNQTLKMPLPPCQYTPRDLVTLNPPEFILAVHKIVSKLRIPTFPDFVPWGENPTRECTEKCLAPAALLSATLKPFMATLLRSGVEIVKRDATSIVPGTKNSRGKRTKKITLVLTPGHILRGLRLQPPNSLKTAPSVTRTAASHDPRAREFAALCLARLGVRLDSGQDGFGTSSVEHSISHTTCT